jgi:hypothetical protein
VTGGRTVPAGSGITCPVSLLRLTAYPGGAFLRVRFVKAFTRRFRGNVECAAGGAMTGWRMDLDRLREQTPGCLHRIHLNNAGAALMSRSTLAAMTTHLRLEAEIGGYEAAAQARDQIDAAYAAPP